MATSAGRGAQTVNTTYFKPMLRKAFHRRSGSPPEVMSDTAKLNGEDHQVKNLTTNAVTNYHQSVVLDTASAGINWWVPDDRTGIYYPKGQEKVMESVPAGAARPAEAIHWFNDHDLL